MKSGMIHKSTLPLVGCAIASISCDMFRTEGKNEIKRSLINHQENKINCVNQYVEVFMVFKIGQRLKNVENKIRHIEN